MVRISPLMAVRAWIFLVYSLVPPGSHRCSSLSSGAYLAGEHPSSLRMRLQLLLDGVRWPESRSSESA